DLVNPSKGTFLGNIPGIGSFQQIILLEAGETKKIFFNSTGYPVLNVKDPILWWPWQMGEPALNTLSLQVLVGSEVSDQLTTSFGIREMSSKLDEKQRRVYQVN